MRMSWYALVAVPLLVPLAVAKVPFSRTDLLTYWGFAVPKVFVLCALVAVSLGFWSLALLRGATPVRAVPGWQWLAAFLALVALSAVFGLSPSTALFGQPPLNLGLVTFVACAALLFLTVQWVTNVSRARELARSAAGGGALVGLVGVIQFLGVDPFFTNPQLSWMTHRGYSTVGNPDFTGTFLILPLTLAFALALSEKDALWRRVAWSCTLVAGCGLFVTLTRGAWLGGLIGIVLVGLTAKKAGLIGTRALRRVVLVGASVVALGAAIKWSWVLQRFTELGAGWQQAGGGRLVLWRDAFPVIAQHPLLGVGPGSYTLGWYRVASLAHLGLRTGATLGDPHNIVLALAANLGIPALLCAAGFVAVVQARAYRGFSDREGLTTSALVMWGWWSAVTALVAALLFSPGTVVATASLFLGLGAVASQSSRVVSGGRALRRAVGVGGLVLAFALFGLASTYLASDFALARSLRDPQRWSDRAVSWAPWDYEARYRRADRAAALAYGAMVAGEPGARALFVTADNLARRRRSLQPARDPRPLSSCEPSSRGGDSAWHSQRSKKP